MSASLFLLFPFAYIFRVHIERYPYEGQVFQEGVPDLFVGIGKEVFVADGVGSVNFFYRQVPVLDERGEVLQTNGKFFHNCKDNELPDKARTDSTNAYTKKPLRHLRREAPKTINSRIDFYE